MRRYRSALRNKFYIGIGDGSDDDDHDDDDRQDVARIHALPIHQDPNFVVGASLFHADFVDDGTPPTFPEGVKNKQISSAFMGIDESPLVKPSDMRKKKQLVSADHVITTSNKEDEKKDDSVVDDNSLFQMVDVLASIDEAEEDEEDEEINDMMDAFFNLFVKANEDGWTELTTAALKAWLELEPSLVEVTDDDGEMPLHWACECAADAEAVITILEVLPEAVHVKNRRGWTALNLAVFSGASTEVILILLEIYPEAVSIQDSENGCTLLHYALLSGAPTEVVREILGPSGVMASDGGHKGRFFRDRLKRVPLETILAILSACPLMAKVTDNRSNTALHFGMIGGAPVTAIEEVLVGYPRATRVINRQGKLPLHCAFEHAAPVEAVLLLLESYPEATKVRDKANMTPLLYGLKHGAPAESIVAVLEESPEAARITDRQGRFPFECGVHNRAPIEVLKILRVAYPEAAMVEPLSGSTALHDCFEKPQPEEDIQYILEVWPEAARVTNTQGKLPLHLALEHHVGRDAFKSILAAYPEAASMTSSACASPIDQLTRVCEHEDAFDELIEKDVIGFLQLMLTTSIEVKTLEKLCKKDNPVALQALFGLFAEPIESRGSTDSTLPCINLNKETILGGTPLEILANLDTPDSADVLLQIVKNQEALLNTPNQIVVIHLPGSERSLRKCMVSFYSTEAVEKTTMQDVARKCMLSNQSREIRRWGERYGRLLEKYKIKSGEYPQYISETYVVVLATEVRHDQHGRSLDIPVALKFMTDKDSFWREITLRAEMEAVGAFESDQISFENTVVRVLEGYTAQMPDDFESEHYTTNELYHQSLDVDKNTKEIKFGRTNVRCGVNLSELLVPYKSIRTGARNPNVTPDLDYLLVMECDASLDASDIILQRETTNNIGTVLHIAKSIAGVLYYFNDKCHICHGDTKDRNFIRQGMSGGFAAINMDNSARHGELLGQKRSSLGYLPPEQARVEYYLRKMESKQIPPYGLPIELIEAKEEMYSIKKKVREVIENDEYALMDRLVAELRTAKQRTEELQASLKEPPAVMVSSKYDMWSFGCLLFKLCTGRQLFDVDTREHVEDNELCKIMCWDSVALQKSLKIIPPRAGWQGLAQVLERLLQADPTERPSSWLDIIDMLEKVNEGISTKIHGEKGTAEDIDYVDSTDTKVHTVLETARQRLQESNWTSIKSLHNSFNILQKEASNMKSAHFQMEQIHCPYMFRFIDKQEFRRLSKEKKDPKIETRDVRFKLEKILKRSEGLLNPTTKVSIKTQELVEKANCMEKAWSKVSRKKGEILYLQLLCGWTLDPVASYEVQLSKYVDEVAKLSKSGTKFCAVGIKASLLWEFDEHTAKMFGFPTSKIPEDLIEKAVNLLKTVDGELSTHAMVGTFRTELNSFGDFLDELERKGKLCHLLDKINEDGVRGSWKDAVRRIAVGKSGTNQKQITYISIRESERLLYSKEDIELVDKDRKQAHGSDVGILDDEV